MSQWKIKGFATKTVQTEIDLDRNEDGQQLNGFLRFRVKHYRYSLDRCQFCVNDELTSFKTYFSFEQTLHRNFLFNLDLSINRCGVCFLWQNGLMINAPKYTRAKVLPCKRTRMRRLCVPARSADPPPPPFLSSIVEWFTTCQTLGVWIGILDDYKSYENSP